MRGLSGLAPRRLGLPVVWRVHVSALLQAVRCWRSCCGRRRHRTRSPGVRTTDRPFSSQLAIKSFPVALLSGMTPARDCNPGAGHLAIWQFCRWPTGTVSDKFPICEVSGNLNRPRRGLLTDGRRCSSEESHRVPLTRNESRRRLHLRSCSPRLLSET